MINDYLNPKKVGKKLQRRIKGKVVWDKVSRYLYSTDASIYKLMPLIVAQPTCTEGVQEIVKFCNKYKLSIHPRGAGTGLGGQALGEGVVIDFARFMRNIIEINPEEDYVWTEVGIKGAPLQKSLGEYNKYIPPDPSSQDYATLGGMISNNASGSHSVKYGDYDKWVEELEVVLADGNVIYTKEYDIESEEFNKVLEKGTLESSIYKNLLELWKKNEEKIKNAYPPVLHNVTGYELRKFIYDGKINLIRLFVGSEGTFGVITKAKMRIETKPKYKVLSTVYFSDLVKAGKAIQYILEQEPAAIELLGEKLLSMARERYPSLNKKLLKELDTMLLVEFEEDDLEECKKQTEITKKKVTQTEKLAFEFLSAEDPEEQANLWAARKSAVPLLYKIKGDRKIIALIEDVVVPPEHLAKYVIELETVCKDLVVEFIAYELKFYLISSGLSPTNQQT
ncbi:MAG: FAD-binding oxidoreductase [Candidatus Heimdallarchaeum endolithica]|uniref:D-lactate dehydrogenase (cytochrome) n=1 Tax=Candidatus Heimdallarchaeum endolithica TaxID=2876572 RepID=A0A9Y1FNA6_9ARCH|nr:MAG: FAD-binding oxidoreductase [Candidatus Heimdallarchaeum endolithica]